MNKIKKFFEKLVKDNPVPAPYKKADREKMEMVLALFEKQALNKLDD